MIHGPCRWCGHPFHGGPFTSIDECPTPWKFADVGGTRYTYDPPATVRRTPQLAIANTTLPPIKMSMEKLLRPRAGILHHPDWGVVRDSVFFMARQFVDTNSVMCLCNVSMSFIQTCMGYGDARELLTKLVEMRGLLCHRELPGDVGGTGPI